ncbi:MAG: nickel pincer cofactor biosynthesis protein LarB [Planctomycetaceae bacterium]|nr:nickel pincer cofactor biosynthesis protein LarB [Planctomycetales bacterium]MCB9873098.1 nickel pincer cofactor biosynthesis protein LarB [Planctomycetaceae bacterium]MCB9937778.1 nickel pincer cofactor biosynthesis protein LarB [Planctomycetaceae bacterium]HRX77739.1 nickel pincer cofactor biosynthesis protein LarB [Pirellulaceae bacterium]
MSDPQPEPFTLDLDRARRCGFPEVVFGEGKCVDTLTSIFKQLLENDTDVLATRIASEKSEQLLKVFPAGTYNERARTFRLAGPEARSVEKCGRVVVVTAGTSDLPVAEEAYETLDWMHVNVSMVHDVGVAGPHRLPEKVNQLRGCDAVVVVAGMEGALPSVVGGYVDCPVIAVPTSVGYGANLGGISALLSMLNSCAANVTVVNIDAGFKGGYIAGLIASRAGQGRGQRDGERAREG